MRWISALTCAAVMLVTAGAAQAGSIEGNFFPGDGGDRIELQFDNGNGERQFLKPRALSIVIRQDNADLREVLCDTGVKYPKPRGQGLTVRTRIGIKSDNGPIEISELALCKLSADRATISCGIEDDGGRFMIANEIDASDCPRLTLIVPKRTTIRVGSEGSADAPTAYIENTGGNGVELPLEIFE